MNVISEEVRRFAEDPDAAITDPSPPEGRVQTAEFSMYMAGARSQSVVSRVRTTEARLDAVIAEARAVLRERGYTGAVWMVGPSSRPAGLKELLLARGFVPATQAPSEPEAECLALVQPPPPVPDDVEVHLCRDYDEYLAALHIALKAFEVDAAGSASWLEAAPGLWKQQDGVDRMALIAYLDGRAVGFGFAAGGPHGLLLGGSGVLPEARGRGVYRALIAERWKIAVALGRPALVIQAGAMSLPVVEKCGFERVCRVDILKDPEIR
jgi:GNAT superfamily N-acetyltransferase